MMITVNNYFTEIDNVGVTSLPETLRKSHEFVVKSTSSGASWDIYQTNETIRKVIDLYLAKLNEHVSSHPPKIEQPKIVTPSRAQVQSKKEPKPKKKTVKSIPKTKESKAKNQKPSGKLVEHIREEVKFVKRYVGLHNKVKSPNAILNLIKALQRSIVQKLIRKDSPLAKEIQSIQDKLVSLYNSMKTEKRIEINSRDLPRLVGIAGGESVYPSINFIKRFVGMQGKDLEEKKIEAFVRQMENAVKGKTALKDDPYADKVNKIYNLLKKRTSRTISVSKAELNGLEGIVKACGCKHDVGKIYDTNGKSLRRCKKKTYSDARKGACSHHRGLNGVLTAEEMSVREFNLLNFNYRWSALIGKPAKNFTMMLHGEPGSGKTTFLLKFTKYLAEEFGKVIYVSSEEFASVTLTKKINELLKPIPQNLHFTENIKQLDLSDYNFIVLDSVNDLGLQLVDYKAFRDMYPDTAFILVLQHTKDGQFRGGKDWEHEVEIAGTIDNGVVSIYKNRYGVKGTLDIFSE